VGRTEIYACGECVSHRGFFASAVLFSLKQEAPASIRWGYVHFLQYHYVTESNAVLQGISLMFPK